jgi:CheY-like chemotaxis protein
MDGFEATRRIRAGEAGEGNRNIPIIAMTANAMASDHEQCLAAGMDDYLAKPVVKAELLAKLESWLASDGNRSKQNAQVMPKTTEQAVPVCFDEALLIAHCANDREFAREIAESVLADMPPQFDVLGGLMAASDWQAAGRVVHTMKGLSAQVGGMLLSERLNAAEQTLRENRSIDPSVMDELREAYSKLEQQLRRWLSV